MFLNTDVHERPLMNGRGISTGAQGHLALMATLMLPSLKEGGKKGPETRYN